MSDMYSYYSASESSDTNWTRSPTVTLATLTSTSDVVGVTRYSTSSSGEVFRSMSPASDGGLTGLMSTPSPSHPPEVNHQLNVMYTASEILVSLFAIFGNALVVYVFCTNRSLRKYRNYYIFALAIADFLLSVGLFGVPFAILASVGLPRNFYGCLFTVSILMVLCTISILCLVAVSVDRYWATTNPFSYYRNMTTWTAVGIILSCWIVGAVIGFLPLFGWHNVDGFNQHEYCYFTEVMDYSYLVFLYFATIIFPACIMGCFYGYIYHIVLIKIRQKGNLAPQLRRPSEPEQSRSGSLHSDNRGTSQILRIIVSEKRREAKAAHKLGIIVLFFLICWMPLYTINCIQAFCRDCDIPLGLLNFTIILSHANSSLNPLLYAYHLKEFRVAMKNALLQLFGKLACGLLDDRLQKDSIAGPFSRSQTLPSLAHATAIANSSGKISMTFRRSPRSEQPRSMPISPKHGLIITNSSNLYPGDKSITSLSLASDSSMTRKLQRGTPSPVTDVNVKLSPEVGTSDSQSGGEQSDDRCEILHGIQIHVMNTDSESGQQTETEAIQINTDSDLNQTEEPIIRTTPL